MINQLTQKLNGHCNFPQPKMTSSDCSTYLTNGQNLDNLSYKTVSAGPHSLSLKLELSTVLLSLHQQGLLGCCGAPDVTIPTKHLEQVYV